jgi:DNA-binding beta-propeller fold protein YncE
MRKLITFFSAVLLCSVGSIAFGVGFLKFEREFSGKGASSGFFGKEINVAFDTKGNTYVADSQNRLIQKISPKGDFLDQILMVDDTTAFKEPGDIAVDSAGNIYVADTAANHIAETENPKIYIFAPCVYKFDALGENVHTYFVGNVSVRPKTVLPAKLIIDEAGRSAFAIQSPGYDRQIKIAVNGDSELYILDPAKTKVHKFAADGKKLTSFSSYGAGNGEIDRGASDIGVDAEGNVFIADTDNHRIVKFNSEGEFLFNFGVHGRDDGE